MRAAFVGSTLVSVGHTGPTLPEGARRYRAAAPISSVGFSGSGGIVSLLAHGDRRFLLLVNRDLHHPQEVIATVDASAGVSAASKDGQLQSMAGERWSTRLDPGDAAILTWSMGPGE